MRTGDRKTATLGVMGTERVKNKLFVAVATGHQSFCALAQLVLAEMPSLHLHAAFVLTVKGLVAACARVFLQRNKSEHQKQSWKHGQLVSSSYTSNDIDCYKILKTIRSTSVLRLITTTNPFEKGTF